MNPELLVALVVFPLLFALEGAAPYYTGRRDRRVHAARNLALALTAGAVGFALAPLVVFSAQAAEARGIGLCQGFGGGTAACAIAAFVLFDLWMYAWHRANHEIPLLWRFHRVHHTDPAMDSTTAFRFHPVEIALSTLANCLVVVALGMSLEVFAAYKAAMVGVILFHHSNLRLPAAVDRTLRGVVVPPSMHRVHHSHVRAETDSNYGTLFSFWDRLFRTFRTRRSYADIHFGIGAYRSTAWQRPWRLLTLPFVRQG